MGASSSHPNSHEDCRNNGSLVGGQELLSANISTLWASERGMWIGALPDSEFPANTLNGVDDRHQLASQISQSIFNRWWGVSTTVRLIAPFP